MVYSDSKTENVTVILITEYKYAAKTSSVNSFVLIELRLVTDTGHSIYCTNRASESKNWHGDWEGYIYTTGKPIMYMSNIVLNSSTEIVSLFARYWITGNFSISYTSEAPTDYRRVNLNIQITCIPLFVWYLTSTVKPFMFACHLFHEFLWVKQKCKIKGCKCRHY